MIQSVTSTRVQKNIEELCKKYSEKTSAEIYFD